MFFNKILEYKQNGKKMLAVLIDPDKHTQNSLDDITLKINATKNINLILIGGSMVFNGVDTTVEKIKAQTKLPVFMFPGSALQVSSKADGILLLSLISGRNPDFLIGHHVISAPKIKNAAIETIPTGYILIDGGTTTSVMYMSNTMPIPANKPDIAVATAMAGELLGLKALYLESGSGALNHVPEILINSVCKNTSIPVIVGGGIRSVDALQKVLLAGADIIVVGTAFETNPGLIDKFDQTIGWFNTNR